MTPHVGGIIVGVAKVGIGVATEKAQGETVTQVDGCLGVYIHVGIVFILLHGEQGIRIINPPGLGYVVVTTRGIGSSWDGGIKGGCRIE